MKKLMIIDGNSLVYRAHFALPYLSNDQGIPTNAIYGFFGMLLRVIEGESPDHLLVAFDTHAPTPRHIAYPEYKAGRPETPRELIIQMEILRGLLPEMGVAIASQEGLEADDMLGIFSRKAEKEDMDVLLVSGDKDIFQLITDKTKVIFTKKGITDSVLCDKAWLRGEYEVEPEQMVEIKGLMGDNSDNIPGVPGVGQKTAIKLIKEYGSVENTLEHADQIKGKLGENLRNNGELARMSRDISRIVTDADTAVPLALEDTAFNPLDMRKGIPKLQELGLRNTIRNLPKDVEERLAEREKFAKANVEKTDIASTPEAFRILLEELACEELVTVCKTEEQISLYAGKRLVKAPIAKDLISPGIDLDRALDCLYDFMETSVEKWVYDIKQWMHDSNGRGKRIVGAAFDAKLAAYLLQPMRANYDLGELTSTYLSEQEYDAATLYTLCREFCMLLEYNSLIRVYKDMELPLVPVLFKMELAGFKVDAEELRRLGKEFTNGMQRLKEDIYTLAGEEFNILSPKQLGAILFDKLKLPVFKKTKSGYSTDAESLESISELSPIVPKILEYRQLSKLNSTYVDGLLEVADKNGKVHTSFNQTVTATGRLSSTEPNLQNIPIRTELGRQLRKAFVAQEGNVLVGADYSQIELRILAHISGDKTMINAFINDEDIHAHTAAQIGGVGISEVTKEMRSAAKAVNFGIVYGISDFGLARQMGVSRPKAAEYMKSYMEKYPGVADYMKSTIAVAKTDGFVRTSFGRKRELPELKSKNHNVRSFGERVAMNAPIQGTAADIIKLAMIAVDKELADRGLVARLILQVHDELIIEAPQAEMQLVADMLKERMENVVKLAVPLKADVSTGKTWYSTK